MMRARVQLGVCLAAVLVASAAFSSLQDAVTAASPGGVVQVCPGDHTVGTVTIDAPVTITGTAGAASTILRGDNSPAEATRVVLQNNSAPIGAGVLVTYSSAELIDCTITGNSAGTAGGGAYVLWGGQLTSNGTNWGSASAGNDNTPNDIGFLSGTHDVIDTPPPFTCTSNQCPVP